MFHIQDSKHEYCTQYSVAVWGRGRGCTIYIVQVSGKLILTATFWLLGGLTLLASALPYLGLTWASPGPHLGLSFALPWSHLVLTQVSPCPHVDLTQVSPGPHLGLTWASPGPHLGLTLSSPGPHLGLIMPILHYSCCLVNITLLMV